jgi:hypothetical protein
MTCLYDSLVLLMTHFFAYWWMSPYDSSLLLITDPYYFISLPDPYRISSCLLIVISLTDHDSLWLMLTLYLFSLLTDALLIAHSACLLYTFSDSACILLARSDMYKDELWVSYRPQICLSYCPKLFPSITRLSRPSLLLDPLSPFVGSLLDLSSHLYHWTSTLKDRHYSDSVLEQILRPHLGQVGPTVVITTYAAKETIGYTLAPSVLPSSLELGISCATTRNSCHSLKLFTSNHKSPYVTADAVSP